MPKILSDVALCLGSVLGEVLLLRRLNLPSVAGFLLAGMLIGPSGLGLISDPAEVQDVAELGIVLLLFAIGLDISLRRIVGCGRFFLGAGAVQLGVTALAGGLVLAAHGTPGSAAALLGFAVALSSTAIVLKVLSGRGEMAAPHGQLALGVPIFQDLAAVAALLFAGRHVAPRLFAHVVRLREVFTPARGLSAARDGVARLALWPLPGHGCLSRRADPRGVGLRAAGPRRDRPGQGDLQRTVLHLSSACGST